MVVKVDLSETEAEYVIVQHQVNNQFHMIDVQISIRTPQEARLVLPVLDICVRMLRWVPIWTGAEEAASRRRSCDS